MIVPMKKVSLIVLASEKEKALKRLRKLGVLHIEIAHGSGEKLLKLGEDISTLEQAVASVEDMYESSTELIKADKDGALCAAKRILALVDEKKRLREENALLQAEADRLKAWGELDPNEIASLSENGIGISLYEMPPSEYKRIAETERVLILKQNKASVQLLGVHLPSDTEDSSAQIEQYRVRLPECSTSEIKQNINELQSKLEETNDELKKCAGYIPAMEEAIAALQKDSEFETYSTGMESDSLSVNSENTVDIVYFSGYIPADDIEKLRSEAKESSWGLISRDPTPDDDAPTKLKNNKFVSLIYPLTDFLGTVPGYFEYDISGWFLGFILIFFGIIFGDGGYGLFICGIAGIPIIKALMAKKPIAPALLLIELMGAATVLWGLLTCTWFGLSPDLLPAWLKSLSVPVISNVYADKIWYPFWTNGEVGLTTTQNLQIVCFSLALIQLSVAHFKGMVRNRSSLKLLGDLGSVLQLIGIFYVVLSLVVNGAVFGLGLVIGGIPIGTIAIAMVGVGFVTNFVFANYEGSIKDSVIANLKNIVSCLLGVVNVFSDIVSYIRLWAVGLAGAAISATVNELAGPFLGNFMFMILAIILLVFGHGLNMILNVLSVIVHGVRLNTLEFSSHLDMSWGGHKYKPFEE